MKVRRPSAKARLLAIAGALACAGGCVASGPLSGGKSLSEVASSQSRRPAVSASYGAEASEQFAAAATPTDRRSDLAASPPSQGGEASQRPNASGEGALSEERVAKILAELPPEEAAAFRQMLVALQHGERVRSTPPAEGSADPVPYVAADSTLPGEDGAAPSSRRTPANPREFSVTVQDFPSMAHAPLASVAASPFVERSLSAFTSPSLPVCQDSPLLQAFQTGVPRLQDSPAESPTPKSPAGPGPIAQASASEAVGSGTVSLGETLPSDRAPVDWRTEANEASKALAAAIGRPGLSDKDRTSLEAKLRLLEAIEHRFAESLAPVDGSPEEQAFWKELCGALQELFDPQATPYDDKRATLALRRLDEAARHLSKAADLDVARLAFCTAVDRFGQYEEFPEYVFSADQEALLYVEVRRFASEAVEEPFPGYRTALEGSYRIVEVGSGKRWDEHAFPVAEEVSRSPRSDFFIAYRVYLPRSLPAGKYRLEFNLRDLVADKQGAGWLDFQVKSSR